MNTLADCLYKDSISDEDIVSYINSLKQNLHEMETLPSRDKTSDRYERDNKTIATVIINNENLAKKLGNKIPLNDIEKKELRYILHSALLLANTIITKTPVNILGLEKYIQKLDK